MAKDGTNRGGRRVRAGAKPDQLKDKLEAGKPASRLLPKQTIMPQPQMHRHEKPPVSWTSISMSKKREAVHKSLSPGAFFIGLLLTQQKVYSHKIINTP